MCENQRALISKVKIDDNGSTHVYYSFSPTRAKFWMGFTATVIVLLGMMVAIKDGAYGAVEDFVATKCGEYLNEFHLEVRPKLDEDRAADIQEAIDAHAAVTSAEYTADIHEIQMEQAKAINDIKVDVATIVATQDERKITEAYQTRMIEELVRRIE